MKSLKCVLCFTCILISGCRTYCDDHPSERQCGGPGAPYTTTRPGGGAGGGSWTDNGTSSSCASQPSNIPIDLSIPYMGQECNELCWAASIGMAAEFFGTAVYECQLASWLVLARTGTQYNCCYYGACNDPYCNQPAQGNEMAAALSQGLGIQGIHQTSPISETQLQLELTNHRPVIVGFHGPFSGHAAIVTGFAPGAPATYHVQDPWPTFGQVFISYDSLRQGPNGNQWHETFYKLNVNGICQ